MQLNQTPEWPALKRHAEEIKATHLRDLIDDAPTRFRDFHLEAGSVLFDFSRQHVTERTLGLLLQCLSAQKFDAAVKALFGGVHVNVTENRAALHMALRADAGDTYLCDGKNIVADVLAERARAFRFADDLRAGNIKGVTGEAIRAIIHVGIGGSDLGPRLLVDALADGKGPAIHFIGNIDPEPLDRVMRDCDPARTLVFVASKTFTTAETLQNARTLQDWLASMLGREKALGHMVALTAAPDTARAFGVDAARIFRFWEWVGGRTSICSVIGLPAMVAMGSTAFADFLKGARMMDAHFRDSAPARNIPVLMAALDVWNINVLGVTARAVLPYMERLQQWPFYLQQLEMESLGKQTDLDGRPLNYATSPALFGATGTPAQHAFMQALHQGSAIIPAEIICVAESSSALQAHHHTLLANALAQAEALAHGTDPASSVIPHKYFPGNRPSSLLVLRRLDPFALGQMIALFEHKVFALSVFWHINPFDQWGVELGKVLAKPIEEALTGRAESGNASLQALIKRLKEN